jgi:hypothetical protein
MDNLFFKTRELVARARKERTGTHLLKINRFATQSAISFKDAISACACSF